MISLSALIVSKTKDSDPKKHLHTDSDASTGGIDQKRSSDASSFLSARFSICMTHSIELTGIIFKWHEPRGCYGAKNWYNRLM